MQFRQRRADQYDDVIALQQQSTERPVVEDFQQAALVGAEEGGFRIRHQIAGMRQHQRDAVAGAHPGFQMADVFKQRLAELQHFAVGAVSLEPGVAQREFVALRFGRQHHGLQELDERQQCVVVGDGVVHVAVDQKQPGFAGKIATLEFIGPGRKRDAVESGHGKVFRDAAVTSVEKGLSSRASRGTC